MLNITNGERFITYIIEGEAESGTICVNGAAARLVVPDDRVIIISYAEYHSESLSSFEPRIVIVDEFNRAMETGSIDATQLVR